MKNGILLLLLTVFLASCGSQKKGSEKVIIGERYQTSITSKNKSPNRNTKSNKKNTVDIGVDESTLYSEIELKTQRIIEFAKTFQGTRYKYGGNDTRGIDCSGLVCASFKNEEIVLPRISREMATQGRGISLEESKEGDLIFFQTNSKKKVINHVGLVVETKNGEIFFIHSTVKKGVIISSMEEPYWKNTFIKVRRII